MAVAVTDGGCAVRQRCAEWIDLLRWHVAGGGSLLPLLQPPLLNACSMNRFIFLFNERGNFLKMIVFGKKKVVFG